MMMVFMVVVVVVVAVDGDGVYGGGLVFNFASSWQSSFNLLPTDFFLNFSTSCI